MDDINFMHITICMPVIPEIRAFDFLNHFRFGCIQIIPVYDMAIQSLIQQKSTTRQ